LTLLVLGAGVFVVTVSLARLPQQPAADKGLVQEQRTRAKKVKVEDPRISPVNNYGFSESTPFGTWSARVEIDQTQSPDPYVPVVVASLRSYAGKGHWGKQLMIESVRLKNRTDRSVAAVKLGWIILSKESRLTGKNLEAALVRGNTKLLNQEWTNKRPFKHVKSLFIDFVKEARPLIKSDALSGDFYLRLRVSEVRFDDGSTWRENDQLACARSLLMLPLVQHSSPTARLKKYVSFKETVRVYAVLMSFPPNSVAGKTVALTTQMPAFAISIIAPTVKIRIMMVFMIVREIATTLIPLDFRAIRKIVAMV
jgi:hypothetical protein